MSVHKVNEGSPAVVGQRSWPSLGGGKSVFVVCILGIVIGVVARFYNLGIPDIPIFDEALYSEMADKYLLSQRVVDAHPPLGKLLIALGETLFGNYPLGWRIAPCLFGIGNIAVMAAIWWKLFRDPVGAAIVAMLVSMDGILIVYSRLGLLDGILFFFTFGSLYAALHRNPKPPDLATYGLVGLTVSIKWVGLAVLGPVMFLEFRRKSVKSMLWGVVIAAVCYSAVVVYGQMLAGAEHPFLRAIRWHRMAARFHLSLTGTHPLSSPWWSWPFQVKPAYLMQRYGADGAARAISARGNPLIWWASTSVVFLTGGFLFKTWTQKGAAAVKDHPLTLFFIGYVCCYLPLGLIHRPMFLYHYFSAYGFALLMLTYWLRELCRRSQREALVYLTAALAVGLYCLPSAVGWIPITGKWMGR